MTCTNERVFRIFFTSNLSRQHVRILWNPTALPVPAPLQETILQYWETLPKDFIFNGKIARLENWHLSENRQALDLYLRPSDYRTLMYSNAHVAQICDTWGAPYLAKVLGISAVLRSVDGAVIAMKRSQTVGEFPCCFDVFGGHIDVAAQQTPCVFRAMQQELNEEVGLLSNEYSLTLIGLIESVPNQKPELVFLADCRLSTREIYERAQNARDQREYSGLITLDDHLFVGDFLTAHHDEFSPSAYGSLCIYAQNR